MKSFPEFCENLEALAALNGKSKLLACAVCGRVGNVVGHGWLPGNCGGSCERGVRGHRFLCSNRHNAGGCGDTFSVMLSSVLRGLSVGAHAAWAFFAGVMHGCTRKAAWDAAKTGMSLHTGYRLWERLKLAQSDLRRLLLRIAGPYESASLQPAVQVIGHMRSAFAQHACPLCAFQQSEQRRVLCSQREALRMSLRS